MKELSNILSLISYEKWVEIVRREPEYDFIESLKEDYVFGELAVISMATGLNDYKLRGKAEIVYWPMLKKLFLENKMVEFKKPPDLVEFLAKNFYVRELNPVQKIRRLKRFLYSPLAFYLWKTGPESVEKKFKKIWLELSSTMYQPPMAKTIVFAMKVMGILLLVYGYSNFDYTGILIPVDKRIKYFTNRLLSEEGAWLYQRNIRYGPREVGQRHVDDIVRNYWNDVLRELRRREPRITMIHLDSLLWQIGTLDKKGIQTYFDDLDLHDIGIKIIELLKD